MVSIDAFYLRSRGFVSSQRHFFTRAYNSKWLGVSAIIKCGREKNALICASWGFSSFNFHHLRTFDITPSFYNATVVIKCDTKFILKSFL